MEYRERECVGYHQVISGARRLRAPMISRRGMVAVMLALGIAVTGCATDPDPNDPENFRCRTENADGTCTSQPADCPVTLRRLFPPTGPHCPGDAELIPVQQDHCAIQLICLD
jgi:hypothetical protein